VIFPYRVPQIITFHRFAFPPQQIIRRIFIFGKPENIYKEKTTQIPSATQPDKNKHKLIRLKVERRILTAKASDEYLSDFMTILPVNCLFDKGKTGCGGTTIAIKNELDTIIAMPYVNVIKNKTDQNSNLLGVYQGVTETEIIDYLQNNEKRKIAVTYDRLEYVINLLEQNGYKPYQQFYLLVDEWHILFNSYAFRNEAVKKVLFHSRKFDRVTYMTATPIEDEFMLEELKDLPIVEVE
jgi:hypothetical protein